MTLPDGLRHTLTHLSRDRNRSRWSAATAHGAPHKPLLLLVLAANVASDRLAGPELATEGPVMLGLAEDFYELLELVLEDRRSSIHMPFWHLQNDGLWRLYDHAGVPIPSNEGRPGGWGPLQRRAECARMQRDLFACLADAQQNLELRELLLDHYFAPPTADLLRVRLEAIIAGHRFGQRILDLAHSARTRDAQRFYQATLEVPAPARSAGFRRAVRLAYDHRCATCGVRIVLEDARCLVEAAHIHEWHDSHDDRLVNGLALCPTCHWAFDRDLLRVVPETYRIRFDRRRVPETSVPGHLATLDDRPLIIPSDEAWHPDRACLEWRWKRPA